MKQYVLSLGQERLTSIIKFYISDCDLHVDGSGSTYRWVGILRAAEKHWNTSEDFAIFQTELEGIRVHPPSWCSGSRTGTVILYLIFTTITYRYTCS
jgi:hypothetical protein